MVHTFRFSSGRATYRSRGANRFRIFTADPRKILKTVGSLATRCCGAATVTTQARCPSTAPRGRFSLLCCQPEALLASLAARTSRATKRCPYGLGTWRGRTINVACAASRNWFAIHQPSPHSGYSAKLLTPADTICRHVATPIRKAPRSNFEI